MIVRVCCLDISFVGGMSADRDDGFVQEQDTLLVSFMVSARQCQKNNVPL